MNKLKLLQGLDTLLKLGLAAILIIAATTKHQYTFYTFLRWVVEISCFYHAYRSYIKKQNIVIFLFLAIAFLFNPTEKNLFQRETWHLIDYSIAGFIVITIIYDWYREISLTSTLNMKANASNNKRLAKEFLLFFSVLVLIGITWGVLLLRNLYFDHKNETLSSEIKSLTAQLDSLPPDKIKKLYDALYNNLVVNYRVGKDEYSIPKEKEADFLKRYPDAEVLPNDAKGYFLFHSADPLKILDKEAQYKKSSWKPPSDAVPDLPKGWTDVKAYLFNFVQLETFREQMKNIDYRDKIYCCTEFDFGTRKLFEAKIDTALKYNKGIDSLKQQLAKEKETKETLNHSTTLSVWSNGEIRDFLLWTLLIIGIVIYPVRICYFILRWSLKTVRQH